VGEPDPRRPADQDRQAPPARPRRSRPKRDAAYPNQDYQLPVALPEQLVLLLVHVRVITPEPLSVTVN
jgi:hypothetical protein